MGAKDYCLFERPSHGCNKSENCGKAIGVINGRTTCILQEISEHPSCDLLDETPASVVLRIEEINGELVFTETEHTEGYFGCQG